MGRDRCIDDDTRAARLSRGVLLGGAALAAAQAVGLLGPLADATFGLLCLVCLACLAVGVVRHRPTPRWPWSLMATCVALFMVGGVARTVTGGLGDLTSARSLVPDAITLAGYAAMSGSLVGMSRSRYRGRPDGLDAILDAALASLSALSAAWVFLIGPALSAEGAPPAVRAVLAAYPLVSSFLVAIMVRMAFSAGAGTGPAFRLLLAAMASVLIGDVAYMVAELGLVGSDAGLLGAPYALAQVTLAAAALHPSMRDMTAALPASTTGPVRSRLAVVAASIAAPSALAVAVPAVGPLDRLVLSGIIAVLTTIAIARVVRALIAQALAQQRLAEQASHDELTGLPNRSRLSQLLPAAVALAHERGRAVAVLFLDVDRFKYVNDSLGHTAGDELLVTIARRLRAAVRGGDVVARIGGDEFVIVLPDVQGVADAVAVAERVRQSFQVPVAVGASQLVISTSVGVVLSSGGDHPANDLIRDADAAMYQAKEAGRDAIAVFDHSMLERAARRLHLDGELRRAVERGEIHVHYQPLVRLPGGRVDGFEALMRWTHPSLGVVPPAEFIPVAEDSGLIVELGAWVLDEACRQVAAWRTSLPGGASLHVSVNVSARQLRAGGFASTVAAALHRWDVPGSALWIELTESLLLDGPSTADGTLDQLRALGVQLSVDDFGTGYSSLAYLKRFPVDQVKIDRAFVRGLDEAGSSDESLTAAIVAMATALGLSTLAEGVETPAQAQRLHHLGVDRAQGYLFARPLPPDEVPAAVERLGPSGTGRLRIVPTVA